MPELDLFLVEPEEVPTRDDRGRIQVVFGRPARDGEGGLPGDRKVHRDPVRGVG